MIRIQKGQGPTNDCGYACASLNKPNLWMVIERERDYMICLKEDCVVLLKGSRTGSPLTGEAAEAARSNAAETSCGDGYAYG